MTQTPDGARAPDARRLQLELQFVRELCEVIASSSEMEPILDWIIRETIRLLSAEEGSIKLLAPDTTDPPHTLVRTLIRPRRSGLSAGSWPQAVSANVMNFLQHRGEALTSRDLLADPRFPALRDGTGQVRSVLAVPLKVGNRITGMLAVTQAKPGHAWTAHDAELLSIVAGNSAGVIEQARLRVEAQERERFEKRTRDMERDLEEARQRQMLLVPTLPLIVGPWTAAGRVVPAREVGGDAFDFRALGRDRLGIGIADVSGKGSPAALLMANVQAFLRAYCDGCRPIREAIRLVNHSVAPGAAGGKFITLFYGEIDPAEGRLSYVNAGHNYPLLRRRDGRLEELREGGLPLGISEDAEYREDAVEFRPGDSLMLYSDGVTDALDPYDNDFGEIRLRTLWQEHGARPPREVIDLLLERIAGFRGRAEQNDDMTVVVVGTRAD